MVASSISITGMSSLIGYTRLHVAHFSAEPFLTSVTGVLQFGQARISSSSWSTGMPRIYDTSRLLWNNSGHEAGSPRRGVQRLDSARGRRARAGAERVERAADRPAGGRLAGQSGRGLRAVPPGTPLRGKRGRDGGDRRVQTRDGARSELGR